MVKRLTLAMRDRNGTLLLGVAIVRMCTQSKNQTSEKQVCPIISWYLVA